VCGRGCAGHIARKCCGKQTDLETSSFLLKLLFLYFQNKLVIFYQKSGENTKQTKQSWKIWIKRWILNKRTTQRGKGTRSFFLSLKKTVLQENQFLRDIFSFDIKNFWLTKHWKQKGQIF
jgi:hypothetical protein